MRTLYDEDREVYVSEEEIRHHWDNELSDEDRDEYDNNFTYYINSMLFQNGGCCKEVTA